MYRRFWRLALPIVLGLAACGSQPATQVSFSSPSPPGWPSTDNHLSAVACPQLSTCVAVGYLSPGYSSVGVHNRTLIEENSGGRWHVVVSPTVDGEAGSALHGVACTRPDDCIAVGDSSTESANSRTLIEQNTGSGWAVVPAPDTRGSLAAIACPSRDFCVAVGDDEAAGRTLIEENTGAGWHVVPSAEVASSSDDRLTAVSCASRSYCIAVGSSAVTSQRSLPLVEQRSASAWAIVPVPGLGRLAGVACPAPSECIATGGEIYIDDNSKVIVHNLIDELTAGGWAAVDNPAGLIGTLGAVACSDPGYCLSVGAPGLAPPDFVERIDNGWTAADTGNIPENAWSIIGLTCVNRDACIGVGDQTLGGPSDYIRPQATLIVEHTTTGWTTQVSPSL